MRSVSVWGLGGVMLVGLACGGLAPTPDPPEPIGVAAPEPEEDPLAELKQAIAEGNERIDVLREKLRKTNSNLKYVDLEQVPEVCPPTLQPVGVRHTAFCIESEMLRFLAEAEPPVEFDLDDVTEVRGIDAWREASHPVFGSMRDLDQLVIVTEAKDLRHPDSIVAYDAEVAKRMNVMRSRYDLDKSVETTHLVVLVAREKEIPKVYAQSLGEVDAGYYAASALLFDLTTFQPVCKADIQATNSDQLKIKKGREQASVQQDISENVHDRVQQTFKIIAPKLTIWKVRDL